MEASIAPMKSDIVAVTSEPRPTEKPATSFSEVMARGAGSVVGGAEAAVSTLPGTSMMAVAVRGGVAGVGGATAVPGLGASLPGLGLPGGLGGMQTSTAQGPGAVAGTSFGSQFLASATSAASGTDGSAASSLQQSEQSNLYYLQLQQQVNQQSQTFEALSNVMKTESDTVKNAIGNMH
jgi:hypothetical protein